MRYVDNALAVFTLIAKPILNGGQAKYLSEQYSDCWWHWPDSIGRSFYVWSAAGLCGAFILTSRGPAVWRHRHRKKESSGSSCLLSLGLFFTMISTGLSGWLGARSFYPSEKNWAIISVVFALVNVVSFRRYNRQRAMQNVQHMRDVVRGDVPFNKKAFLATVVLGVLGSVQLAFYSFATNRDALQVAQLYFIDEASDAQNTITQIVSLSLSVIVFMVNLLTRTYACYHWFDKYFPKTRDQYVAIESVVSESNCDDIKTLHPMIKGIFIGCAAVEVLNTWLGYSETFVSSVQHNACDNAWLYRIAGLLISVSGSLLHMVFTVDNSYEELKRVKLSA